MDDDPHRWLFDPPTAHDVVLARRPFPRTAVACVVSDVVWHDVVGLLRWATAATGGLTALEAGRWWRLAASCADLLRRLPRLSDELGQPWDVPPRTDPDEDVADISGAARVHRISTRLAALLRSGDPVPLRDLAVEIDALGAAAISAFAEQAAWAVPGGPP
ncbi:hypothetical protein [Blastococcus deserti]|uniref:Uncharacterized protein n=1 Tax=Blastococcus deserti TaxID=2259033 RepID=A0ABW4X6C8_9ACTN